MSSLRVASWPHPLQLSSAPRGARTSRGPDKLAPSSVRQLGSIEPHGQVSRDRQQLDLRRALVDAQHTAVAVQALDLALAHVTGPAVDLHRLVDHREALLGGDVLRDS